MYPGASDALLEKREYSDGIRYVPATEVAAGVSYYVQRKDEQGRDYYLNTNPTPSMSNAAFQPTPNPVQATYAPISVYASAPGNYAQYPPNYTATSPSFAPPYQVIAQPGMMVLQPQAATYNTARFGGLAAAHITIGILSIFIPFFYIVAFPILYGVLKKEMKSQNLLENSYYAGKLSVYTALGWTTFVVVVIGHFFMVFGWANITTYVCSDKPSFYGDSNWYSDCTWVFNPTAFGIGVTGSVLSLVAFILLIVLLAVGASWIRT